MSTGAQTDRVTFSFLGDIVNDGATHPATLQVGVMGLGPPSCLGPTTKRDECPGLPRANRGGGRPNGVPSDEGR